MTTESFTTTIITASEGMYLTQSNDRIDIQDRIICNQIALGRYDSPENWKEISAQEAKRLSDEKEAASNFEDVQPEL